MVQSMSRAGRWIDNMEAIWGILKSDMLNCMTSVETITHSLHKKFHLVFSTGWISLKIFFCFLSVYLTWSCSKAIYGNFYYNHEKTTKIIAITTAILNICFKHPSFLLKNNHTQIHTKIASSIYGINAIIVPKNATASNTKIIITSKIKPNIHFLPCKIQVSFSASVG